MAVHSHHTVAAHHHAAHNGAGTTGFVVGAFGVVCGGLAFLFPVAAAFGLAALVLGVIGVRRVQRGEATNRSSAYVAVVLGLIALLLATAGLLVTVVATEEIAPPPATIGEDR